MKRLHLWLFTIIIFAAFAFRLSGLGSQSLWHDEAWSVFSAYHPLAWGVQGTDPNAPPAFYMSLGGWMQLAGDSVWSLRFWSLLLGVLLAAIVGFLTRRWYGDRAGLLAALFVAFNPILWVFSQEIRAYVVMPLGAILLLFLMERILQTGSRRAWIYLAVVEWLTLYSQNLAVPIVAWLNVTMITALILRREWRKLFRWMVVQSLLGLLYLPWLITQKPTGTPLNTTPPINIDLLWNVWQSYFSGIRTMINADNGLMLLCLLLIPLTIIGLFAVFLKYRTLRTGLLLSQALLIPVFETAIIYAAHIDFHPRYYIVGVPATLMLVAAGLSIPIPRWVRPAAWLLQAASAALIIGIGVHVLKLVEVTPVYRHDDFRAIAEHYKKDLTGQDAIIIPYGWEPTLDYYIQKMNIKARVISLPLYSSSQTIINTLARELPKVKRTEFLTWYQLPADVRGAYPCLLGGMGIVEDRLTVQGIQTERYHDFKVVYPRDNIISGGLDFGPILLQGSRSIDGAEGICFINRWVLRKQTSEPLRVSTKIMLSPLVEVGGNNGELLNNQQAPTNRWDTNGEPVATFEWIPLPAGLPSDFYSVSYKVYNASQINGLDAAACRADGDSTCTPHNVGKRPVFQVPILMRPAPLRPVPENMHIGDSVIVRNFTNTASVKDGECIFILLQIVNLDPQNENRIQVEKQFTDGFAEKVFLGIPGSPNAQFYKERYCIPLSQSGALAIDMSLLDKDNPSRKAGTVRAASIPIETLARTYAAPELTNLTLANASFPMLATLKGVQLPKIQAGQPFDATLLWQMEYQKDANLRVFVQVLDNQGRLIAQHDGVPVNGTRPANNWEQGEYLVDTHKVEWARSDYKGAGKLIIGFYDPDTFLRAETSDKQDHYEMPITIE